MLRRPHRLLRSTLFLALAIAPLAHAQTPTFSSLEERMSHAEFVRLGLDKLSPEQLEGLNEWLRAHGASGPSLDATTAAAAPTATAPQGDVHSRLVGDFRGWKYGTVFELENGQRWQVTDDTPMTIRSVPSPMVTVRKGFLGNWLLSVDGINDSVHVTQAAE